MDTRNGEAGKEWAGIEEGLSVPNSVVFLKRPRPES